MPAQTVGLAIVIIALLMLYQYGGEFVRKHACFYCGEIVGHDDDCPFLMGED